jgi:dTDP-4-dehydrorhamnose 3,5-epimerase
MKLISTSLPGVILIDPDVFKDDRGFFIETFHKKRYAEGGIDRIFIQDNLSHSKQGTLRGLHYQLKNSQGKLIYVVTGDIFDVAVDIRHGSPTFGKWAGTRLSEKNRKQIYIPEGFAHGFCVLSETADVIYKCTDFYTPGDEYGVSWADAAIGIDWPIKSPILSDKDSKNPALGKIPANHLPVYTGRE